MCRTTREVDPHLGLAAAACHAPLTVSFHLTGIYIFPDEHQLHELFDTLSTNSNYPLHNPYLYAEDFKAYAAEEWENHVSARR